MKWYTEIIDMARNATRVRISWHDTKEAAEEKAREEMAGWMEDDDVLVTSKKPSFGRHFFQVKTPSDWVDFIAVVGQAPKGGK